MKLSQNSSWSSFEAIKAEISNDQIKSWLLEEGPITKRIKSKASFRLELIQDEFSKVKDSEKKFINTDAKKIKAREVLLYGDNIPVVFARTIIPNPTIEKGLTDLGKLGTRPLGDILFEKNIFTKEEVVYASFKDRNHIYWGRKARYSVKGLPFSVMEVFLIK